jgi:hypothetical protein
MFWNGFWICCQNKYVELKARLTEKNCSVFGGHLKFQEFPSWKTGGILYELLNSGRVPTPISRHSLHLSIEE